MCLLTFRPVPPKGSSHRRDSLPPEPPRIIIRKPPPVIKLSPVYMDNIDYADGWIAGRAQDEAEKAKKPSDAPPSSTLKKPSKCCEGRRRISNASTVSIRSLRQMKRKLEDIYRRHQDEKVKEQERWEHEHRERAKDRLNLEKLDRERAKDRLNLEKLEKELNRERQRRRAEEYYEGQYRGLDWKSY